MKTISSTANPLIKDIALLQRKSRERKQRGIFVVEGKRELSLAVQGGYSIEKLLFCPELIDQENLQELVGELPAETIAIGKDVYQKIAYRDSTEGIIACLTAKAHSLASASLPEGNILLLVAEAPEKPGNIGALLRTADAAGLDAVIMANPRSDLYNPNVIRSSVGTVFTTTIYEGSTAEIIQWLKENKVRTYCAALQASSSYLQTDLTGRTALVVGTEADGLSEQWLENSDQNIIIPMAGAIDSMNVSVAAGILIFEAKRQRSSS